MASVAKPKEEGVTDVAIFLLTAGEEAAAEVMRHLSPKEVQSIGEVMARLQNVSKDRIDAVIAKFKADIEDLSTFGIESEDYIRNVMTRALGDDRAALILDRILQDSETSGIEGLRWIEPSTVAEMIKNEHPQIIATILVYLERDQAMLILREFSERLRSDVMLRIATLDGIQPLALRDLNEVLKQLIAGTDQIRKQSLGGIKTAAEILTYAGSVTEQSMLAAIKDYDPDLAQRISDEMFTFDNVVELDDRSIQTLLREVPNELLVVALKGASQPMRERIYSNMSSRAAEGLREDLESRGPMKLSDVEASQKELLKVVKRLVDEGAIAIMSKGGDEQYV